MNQYLDDFRLNMKYYRELREISQTRLAILCDCGTGTIGGIESGKAKPSFDMIVKIAQALCVSPADLFARNVTQNRDSLKKILKSEFDLILSKI